MTNTLLELLSSLPVFSALSPRECQEVEKTAVLKNFDSKECIALQGDIWPYVFVLASGEISVQKLSVEGRSLGAWWLSPIQVFWSPSIFDDQPLPATLEVRESCKIYFWQRDQIIPAISGNRNAMWELCRVLTQRIRQASEVVEDLAFHPVTSRLARLLIKKSESVDDLHLERSLTLDEMAAMIGTTPVMVCKILSRFADQGIIKVSRTEFEFLNFHKLEDIAGI